MYTARNLLGARRDRPQIPILLEARALGCFQGLGTAAAGFHFLSCGAQSGAHSISSGSPYQQDKLINNEAFRQLLRSEGRLWREIDLRPRWAWAGSCWLGAKTTWGRGRNTRIRGHPHHNQAYTHVHVVGGLAGTRFQTIRMAPCCRVFRMESAACGGDSGCLRRGVLGMCTCPCFEPIVSQWTLVLAASNYNGQV